MGSTLSLTCLVSFGIFSKREDALEMPLLELELPSFLLLLEDDLVFVFFFLVLLLEGLSGDANVFGGQETFLVPSSSGDVEGQVEGVPSL